MRRSTKPRPTTSWNECLWACDIQGFLEDLVLYGLATEKPFEIAKALLQISDAERSNDVLVHLNCSMAAFQHPTLPGKEL